MKLEFKRLLKLVSLKESGAIRRKSRKFQAFDHQFFIQLRVNFLKIYVFSLVGK